MNFEIWKEEVNRVCIQRFGVSTEYLPDADYWHMWRDGWTALDVINFIEEREVDF